MAQHEQTIQADTKAQLGTAARPWWERLGLLGGVLLLLWAAWWLRAPLHGLPLERDEGAYATIAARWLAGDALYRDLFDHKPPLIYLAFALARLVPGDPVQAIRVLATLYMLASGLALLALGRRLYGRWAALAALTLFLAYGSSVRFQGITFNSEAVLTLPAILGCLLAVLGLQARRAALLAAAGVCVGLAITAKPVGAALLAPLVLAAVALSPSIPQPLSPQGAKESRTSPSPAAGREGRGVRALLLALGGALLPLLAFTFVLWRQGALPGAYEALVVYNRLYAEESVAQGWDPVFLWRIWAPMLTLALPAFLGLAASFRRAGWRSPAHVVATLWGLALLATAILSLRAYPHYYLAAVPFFCLWAGAGIAMLGRGLRENRSANYANGRELTDLNIRKIGAIGGFFNAARRWLAAPLALAVLAALLAPPIREIWPLRSQTPYEQIGTLYGPEGYAYFGHADEVAAYVVKHVRPDQTIFVWAAEPEIYYLSGRRPATRFVYDYPIERIPGARDGLIVALRNAPPPLIITYHAVRPMGFDPFMPDYRYELRATIGGYDVYGR